MLRQTEVLDSLDVLGELLADMLQRQQSVEVRTLYVYPSIRPT